MSKLCVSCEIYVREDSMPEDRKELHKKIWTNLLVAAGILLFLIFVLPRLLRFFAPLVTAWVVALIANPLIRFLEKRIRIMRKHGSALVIIVVLALIGLAIYLLSVFAFGQIRSLITELPGIYASVTTNLQNAVHHLQDKYHIVPDSVQNFVDGKNSSINDYILDTLKSWQGGSLTAVGSMASSLADFFVLTILTILTSYFMIVEKENISAFFRKHTPKGIQDTLHMMKDICIRALGGYFKAHLKIMAIIFVITVIPFTIMGIGYGALLALLIAIVDFLPFSEQALSWGRGLSISC